MPSPITLLIAYPKEPTRAGLRAMLAGSPIKIVGESEDASSTITVAKKHKQSVMLVGAAIPGGAAFGRVRPLSSTTPATTLTFTTASDNTPCMPWARTVGAADCLLNGMSHRALVTAAEGAPGASNSGQ